ncbi:MAG: hypothetical protein AAGI69_13590 [Cyanobacteria bacterium P01_H01_bin.21]
MQPLIGLVLETFPKASETFILNEILELERQGLDLHIFSLRCFSEQDAHPEGARVKSPVTYLPSLLPKFDIDQERELVSAHVELFEQDSETYLKTSRLYLKSDKGPRFNNFLQAGYLVWQLQKLGIIQLHVYSTEVSTATVEIAQSFSGGSYSITAHTHDTYLSDQATLNRRMIEARFTFSGATGSNH